ncbi:hypothetical protein C4D60_Mb04t30620 [Musa balbisiana]|uniref:Uncharacterized protein n=1 Tax=Musa balbisiana TaxID=52838 RepID=A0A4S8KFZ1_MUSBA|nr:hypothetical protein C4D60_Mb04t30620 [Musa balbisiana]
MEAAGEEEQDGLSVHSPGQAPPSSASSLPKEQSQVELELRVLEALEIYPPWRLQGIHRHFVLYGLMEYLRRSFDRHFSAEEVLQLLDRFYNLELLRVKSRPDRIVPTTRRFGNLCLSTPSALDFFRIDRNRSEGKTSRRKVDSSD